MRACVHACVCACVRACVCVCAHMRDPHLPRRRVERATLVEEEPLDLGVLGSPPSEGVGSLTGAGAAPGSWMTMMSSLLC